VILWRRQIVEAIPADNRACRMIVVVRWREHTAVAINDPHQVHVGKGAPAVAVLLAVGIGAVERLEESVAQLARAGVEIEL
jgi:hypothetical protein